MIRYFKFPESKNINYSFYNYIRDRFFIYEHSYYKEFENKAFALTGVNENTMYTANLKEIKDNKEISNTVYKLTENKSVIVTYGDFSKNQFDEMFFKNVIHFDLMTLFVKVCREESFLKLSDVFYSLVVSDDEIENFNLSCPLFDDVGSLGFNDRFESFMTHYLKYRIMAIDYLLISICEKEIIFKELPKQILADFEKYMVEKQIEIEILDEREKRRL